MHKAYSLLTCLWKYVMLLYKSNRICIAFIIFHSLGLGWCAWCKCPTLCMRWGELWLCVMWV